MARTKLSCFWNRPDISRTYQAAVSLHSHTNHSKESLFFIPQFAEKWALLNWALKHQCSRSAIPIGFVDFARSYWNPPLTAKLAFEVEREQIEHLLGLMALVSLTDHDTIEAPVLLRMVPEAGEIPFSLEWSVPFEEAIFHLGIHNLPGNQAQAIMADLAGYTQSPSAQRLSELIAMLDESPDVLIVFNHPLWDLRGIGQQRYQQLLHQFLQRHVRFLHAFELNAMRGRKENDGVIRLAGHWHRLLVSGGDRHGCEPSGALNLTEAKSFSEFVREVRAEQRSHVLFMPQYAQSMTMRTTQTLLDVIREFPQYAAGHRRWDDRVFYSNGTSSADRPLSVLWKAPPAFIERIFSAIRLSENVVFRRMFAHVLKGGGDLHLPTDIASEKTL